MDYEGKRENVFYNEKAKMYLCDSAPFCSVCGQTTKDIFYYERTFLIRKQYINYFCYSCVNKRKKLKGEFSEILSVNIVDVVPQDSILLTTYRPEIHTPKSLNEVSLFDVEKIGGKTIDHTKLAGRESLEGAKIGLDITEQLEQKEKPINDVKQLNNFFDDLLSAKPAIPQSKKPLLEGAK